MIDAERNRFTHGMNGDPEDLRRCLRAAAGYLEDRDLESKARYAAELTLEELLTNAIKYGAPENGDHEIRVHIDIDPLHVRITVTDNGIPFDPTREPPPVTPTDAKNAKVGGLGLQMIRRMTNAFQYNRNAEENRIMVSIDR